MGRAGRKLGSHLESQSRAQAHFSQPWLPGPAMVTLGEGPSACPGRPGLGHTLTQAGPKASPEVSSPRHSSGTTPATPWLVLSIGAAAFWTQGHRPLCSDSGGEPRV